MCEVLRFYMEKIIEEYKEAKEEVEQIELMKMVLYFGTDTQRLLLMHRLFLINILIL